jgi:hypothetical protein
MKVLLTHLQELDAKWVGIMKEDMSTSPPRTLIQNMNVHLGRWIKDPTKVQLVLDSLAPEPDQSEDPDNQKENCSPTSSEKSESEYQELKYENSKGDNNLVEPTSKIEDNVS